MTISFVIFDMAGVLYDWDTDIRLGALERLTGLSGEDIDRLIYGSEFEERAEAGDPPTGDAYLAALSRRLNHRIDRQTWISVQKAMMRPRPQTLAVASAVSEEVDTALLTNNGMMLKEALPFCAPEAIEIFGESAHVSAEFGARKPDVACYLRICERYGHKPSETLFIDDSQTNVRGAEAAGLQAHLYTDAGSLKSALHSCGIL
ncbi:HAD family phosphatase [Stappia sp. F7233]|uniref:HAD family phosphatase n=1 Tax=Stappia albiluteola TaxID=2758565 RepID=A0A839AI08_9HYPH|nr:HAD family phosphatase [Stappia albiluteola]MBA5778377.1 HAD family phosphatase [Stappia albiluteola]